MIVISMWIFIASFLLSVSGDTRLHSLFWTLWLYLVCMFRPIFLGWFRKLELCFRVLDRLRMFANTKKMLILNYFIILIIYPVPECHQSLYIDSCGIHYIREERNWPSPGLGLSAVFSCSKLGIHIVCPRFSEIVQL